MLPILKAISLSSIAWSAIVIVCLYIVFKLLHGLGKKDKGAKVIDLDVSERPYHEDQKLISSKTKQQ